MFCCYDRAVSQCEKLHMGQGDIALRDGSFFRGSFYVNYCGRQSFVSPVMVEVCLNDVH